MYIPAIVGTVKHPFRLELFCVQHSLPTRLPFDVIGNVPLVRQVRKRVAAEDVFDGRRRYYAFIWVLPRARSFSFRFLEFFRQHS